MLLRAEQVVGGLYGIDNISNNTILSTYFFIWAEFHRIVKYKYVLESGSLYRWYYLAQFPIHFGLYYNILGLAHVTAFHNSLTLAWLSKKEVLGTWI